MMDETTQERRFLVYIALNKIDSHTHLLSPDRLFDIAINDFTGRGVECDAEWSFAEPGQKLAGFHKNHSRITRFYSFYALLDDDIEVSVEDLNRLFLAGERHGLDLYQPALIATSYTSYKQLLERAGSAPRPVAVVEMMVPFFSASALDICLPTFAENQSGWGLDLYAWPHLLSHTRLCVVDWIPVKHRRPIRSKGAVSSSGLTYKQEMRLIQTKYQTPLERIGTDLKTLVRGVPNSIIWKLVFLFRFGTTRLYMSYNRLTRRGKALLYVRVGTDRLTHEKYNGYERRHESTYKLIEQAYGRTTHATPKTFIVNTGDAPIRPILGIRLYNYSATSETGDDPSSCPDFLFDGWKEVGLDDYEVCRRETERAGEVPPSTKRLGWIGSVSTIETRRRLVDLSRNHPDLIEAISMDWNRDNPDQLTSPQYLSFSQQVERWNYLIDVEGHGYSGRLKLLLFSRRVVFVADRPFKEWFFPDLRPWVHYVPVKRDLSDLLVHLERIAGDPELATEIASQGFQFAQTHLTREHAITRWIELLTR